MSLLRNTGLLILKKIPDNMNLLNCLVQNIRFYRANRKSFAHKKRDEIYFPIFGLLFWKNKIIYNRVGEITEFFVGFTV